MDVDKLFKHFTEHKESCYVNEIYNTITHEKLQASFFGKLDLIKIYSLLLINIFISGLLLVYNLLYEKKFDYNKKIAIARVSVEKYKIARIDSEIQFVEDDIKNFDFTIYQIGSRLSRLKFLIFSYIKNSILDFNEVLRMMNSIELNCYKGVILREYAKRIPHTVIHKNALELVIKNYRLEVLYTGATYERFGLIANHLSDKYNKTLVCIPHGIETNFKMPAGYAGDIFYSSSDKIAKKLNEQYSTTKFIFDETINQTIYRLNCVDCNIQKNNKHYVVFFTQPTYEASLNNIIIKIAQYMKTKNQRLYIKVHPRENAKDYLIENTEFINDIKEGIIGKLCISYFSTVLIEAIYNDSKAISIVNLVEDDKGLDRDYGIFYEDRIIKPNNFEELFREIDKYLEIKINGGE